MILLGNRIAAFTWHDVTRSVVRGSAGFILSPTISVLAGPASNDTDQTKAQQLGERLYGADAAVDSAEVLHRCAGALGRGDTGGNFLFPYTLCFFVRCA